ncbi:MAG: hypothetical protein D6802_12675 [Ardenticatenia bacterium]|nr:MAG: hypothetical protein D6802_12675 [Ardenticatenia bacterium]
MNKRLLLLLSLVVVAVFAVSTRVTTAAPNLQANIEVTSPRPNAVLRGTVSIQGTATHPDFWKYEVHFAPGLNPPNEAWSVLLVSEQPVVNGQLAVWNTATVPDGTYSLRLRVVRRDGNYEEIIVRPVSVQNSGPEPTPTPEGTPTPPPTLTVPAGVVATLTPVPQTPIISQPTIQAPPTATPQATREAVAVAPTSAPLPNAPVDIDEVTSAFSLAAIRSACLFGAGLTLTIFLFVGALLLIRRVLRQML